MTERVKEEIELLRNKYSALQADEQLRWILIPDFPLPADRYKKERTKLLLALPVGYPQTAPDNFFVDGDLQLKNDGGIPAFNVGSQSSSGPAPLPGNWGWFSWHPHPNGWRPAATIESGDNLLTFIRAINMCLRGEEVS